MNESKSKLHLWKEHITVLILILIVIIITIVLIYNKIDNIPRSALPEFADMLATLLGLTFTAFSILVSITPRIRKDFLKTDIFDAIGIIFYVTLILQFFALIFTFISYMLYMDSITSITYILCMIIAISLTVSSLGFLLYLIKQLFLIFKSVKNQSSERD